MNNKRIIKNIGISMIMKPISMVISFLYTPIALHYLGDTNYGIWVIVLNIISWITYFDIGIGNGLRNKLAETFVSGEKEKSRSYVSTACIATAIISLAFCSVLLFVWNIADLSHFFKLDVSGNEADIVVGISIAFLCVNFILALGKTVLYAVQQPSIISVVGVVGQALQLLAIFLLSKLTSGNIIIVAIAYNTICLVENIILNLIVGIKYPYLIPKAKSIKKQYFRPLMSLGIGFFVIQVCSLILNTTDNLLISNLFGPEEVTPYNIVYKVFYMFVQVHAIIIMPMWSAYTAAKAEKNSNWMRKNFAKVNLITLAISIVAIALIFGFRPLAKIWLGKELNYSANLILVTVIYMIVQMFSNNFSSLLCGVGELKVSAILSGIGAVINIPLSWVFAITCRLGVVGIVLGSLCVVGLSFIVLPIVSLLWFKKFEEKLSKENCENNMFQNKYLDEVNAIDSELIAGEKQDNVTYTFLIPTHNRPHLLQSAIQSALNQIQEGIPYEVLIVDDNPNYIKSETYNVIKQNMDKKILYYVNSQNLGMSNNWNKGLQLANGKYIIMLHDDDVVSPYFLSTIHNLIHGTDFMGIIGVGYEKFIHDEDIKFEPVDAADLEEIKIEDLFLCRSINIVGMTFHKEMALKMGGFYQEDYPNIDTNFIYRTMLHARVLNIKNKLAGYRIADNVAFSGDTLSRVIIKFHLLRKDIAQINYSCKEFFSKYEAELLYNYVLGANDYWDADLNYKDIFKALDVSGDVKKRKLFFLKLKTKTYFLMRKIKNNFKRIKL